MIDICPSCEPFEFEAIGLVDRYHRTRSFSMDQMLTTSFQEDWDEMNGDHMDIQMDMSLNLDAMRIEPGGIFLDDNPSPDVISLAGLSSSRSRRSHSMGSLPDIVVSESEKGPDIRPNGDLRHPDHDLIDGQRVIFDEGPENGDQDSDPDKTPDQSTMDLTAESQDNPNLQETTSVPDSELQDQPGELRVEWSTSVSQSDDEPGTSPPGDGLYVRRRYASLKSPNRKKVTPPVERRKSTTACTQTDRAQKIPDFIPLGSQRSFSVCGTIAALFGRTRLSSSYRSSGMLSKSLDERSLRMARERQESEQGIFERWKSGRKYSQWIWEKWDSAVNLMRQRGWVCVYVSRNTRRLRSAHGRPCFKIEGSQRAMTTERQEELSHCWTHDITLIRAYFTDYPMRLERDIASVLISSYQWEYKWFSCFRKDQTCGIGHRNEWLGLKGQTETASVDEMLRHLDEVCKGWLKEYHCDTSKTQRHPIPAKYET